MTGVRVLPGARELAYAAVEVIQQAINSSLARQERFSLVLSGGSTPQKAYQILATPQFARQIDWTRVHIFWGDERCVPPHHPDSNYRMAHLALLEHIPIPAVNIHPVHSDLDPPLAAQEYEAELRLFFVNQGKPAFDLVLLGLGDDGHTASLFPGSPALDETRRWVVDVEHNHPPPPLAPRVSLSIPALNQAAAVLFLVSGATKATLAAEILGGKDKKYPAQLIQPQSGRVLWLLDRAAASEIAGSPSCSSP